MRDYRDIKFRQYYQGDDDSFSEWNYFDLRTGGMVVDGGWENPQQWTGLKDRHGKEIWEGDIVKWEGVNLEVRIGGYMGVRYGREYDEAGYGVYGVDDEEMNVVGIGCFDQDKSVEVIGNIWENPELINKGE